MELNESQLGEINKKIKEVEFGRLIIDINPKDKYLQCRIEEVLRIPIEKNKTFQKKCLTKKPILT